MKGMAFGFVLFVRCIIFGSSLFWGGTGFSLPCCAPRLVSWKTKLDARDRGMRLSHKSSFQADAQNT